MKKTLLVLMIIVAVVITTYAGGLLTNTNQSATWVRLPARNASTGIDAVYYNPAGLMKLENGLHLSLSNQSIFQTREIENNYGGPGGAYGLNEHVYKGSATALAFPSIYAVYKMDRLALSFGFNPIGGGGSATYEKGLPSFEMSASDLVPTLASQGVTAYRLNAYFEGSSVFLGFQGGLSYKLSDWISVGAGVRYVTAMNTYQGHLTDIELNKGGNWVRADAIIAGIATSYSTAAAGTSALVAGGAGSFTFAQLLAANKITAAQKAQFEGALTGAGFPVTTAVAAADAIFKGASAKYTATATLLGNQTADVEQNGSGITPFFSVNISPSDKLNIGIKYEMATKLELKNATKEDLLVGFTSTGTPITMFPDKDISRSDLPALLTFGLDYSLSEALKLSTGFNYYFDKSADYGHKVDADLNSSTPSTPISNEMIIDQNGLSLQLGLEYKISDKFLISSGYSWANKGVNAKYQSDLTYGLATHTVGLGGAYNITEKIQLNLGASNTFYMKDQKTVDHIFAATSTNIPSTETYKKNTILFGIGLDFSF
jgi:long-chain fatty acid transport protein